MPFPAKSGKEFKNKIAGGSGNNPQFSWREPLALAELDLGWLGPLASGRCRVLGRSEAADCTQWLLYVALPTRLMHGRIWLTRSCL